MDVSRLDLYIDHLVLNGVRTEDAPALARSLSKDLRRLLLESPIGVEILATQDRGRSEPSRLVVPRGASGGVLGTLLAELIARRLRP
jgi:hypothetical protein